LSFSHFPSFLPLWLIIQKFLTRLLQIWFQHTGILRWLIAVIFGSLPFFYFTLLVFSLPLFLVSNPHIGIFYSSLWAYSIDPVKEHDLISIYFEELRKLAFTREKNGQDGPKFIYTAMHGVGHPFAIEAFKSFGLPPFESVQQQQDPDPNFSTVQFPNPEEGKDSLDLAIKLAGMSSLSLSLSMAHLESRMQRRLCR